MNSMIPGIASDSGGSLVGTDSAVDPPYMPQLDALRALAVIGVMAHHFDPHGLGSDLLPLGMGVRLFFVLSGFLITSILLRCRDLIDRREQGWGITLWRFYIRRFLRIFPVYYVTLGILWLVGIESVRQSIGWHMAYLSNVKFALSHGADTYVGHFWSLAVEEQFYLVWPWFVLLAPKRVLGLVAAAAMILGPLYRLRAGILGWDRETASYLTLANIDVLAAGAILAMLWSCFALRNHGDVARRWIRIVGFGVGLTLLIALLVMRALSRTQSFHFDRPLLYFVTLNSMMALTFAAMIDAAAVGIRGPIGAALNWLPLRFVGKISYGVYVFHNLMPHFLGWALPAIHLQVPAEGFARLLVCGAASIALATVSWHVLELPINRLKRHFPYRTSVQRAINPAAAI